MVRPSSHGSFQRDWGGLFASALGFSIYPAVGWVLGFPDWVIQQCVLFLLLLLAGSLPGLSLISHHTDRLAELYEREPRFASGIWPLILALFPTLNWILVRESFLLCVMIVLTGLPLDLISGLVTQYVIPFSRWGPAHEQGFGTLLLIQAYGTFCATPSLMMLVVHLRGRIGKTHDW